MIRLLRHLAYEGPRHTGRYGFGGRWVYNPDGLFMHRRGGLGPHFATTEAGWAKLRRMLRPEVVQPGLRVATATLGGGYDGWPVFVGECPCVRAPVVLTIPRRLPPDDVVMLKAAWMAARAADPKRIMIIGGSS